MHSDVADAGSATRRTPRSRPTAFAPGQSERLIVRCRAGDLSAFTELHAIHAPGICAYLSAALRDEEAVQDVAQQVFLKLFQAVPTLDVDNVPFRPWLYVIARTTMIDHLRTHRWTDSISPAELDSRRDRRAPNGLDGLEWGSSARIHELIEALPGAQKQVLVLLFRCALPVTDVATVLGRTPESVRQLRHRALQRLHERLTPASHGVRTDR